jgi:hypothetical protein
MAGRESSIHSTMAPIKFGNVSVEIAVNNIDGFIHELVDLPSRRGFWVTFTAKDDKGKAESFPLVDANFKVRIYQSYQEALYDAAQKLKGSRKI